MHQASTVVAYEILHNLNYLEEKPNFLGNDSMSFLNIYNGIAQKLTELVNFRIFVIIRLNICQGTCRI